MSKSNGSTGSQTGSGYSTDVSDDNLPHDAISPASDVNEHSDSDDQVTVEEMLSMWQQKTSLPQNVISIFGSSDLQTNVIELKHFIAIIRCTVGLKIF